MVFSLQDHAHDGETCFRETHDGETFTEGDQASRSPFWTCPVGQCFAVVGMHRKGFVVAGVATALPARVRTRDGETF